MLTNNFKSFLFTFANKNNFQNSFWWKTIILQSKKKSIKKNKFGTIFLNKKKEIFHRKLLKNIIAFDNTLYQPRSNFTI